MFSNSRPLEVIVIIVLAVIASMTGEFVTFIMLGLILLQLHNIQRTIKQSNDKNTSEEGSDV
ncbi:hypothetical protein [Geomicrobium sp. JCM 19038]|uniref:hypothetical protein n=1 Tax=Geomicrobium sp. JCM 19038 TaxID=1460635 RepID=UPI00045F47D8|nr:hypothetical protein [Geomicrobium sp. JCM 19038]GAK08358.1 hypothetical protein JCM19038_2140 [Geomicrobium sp. JCM 19038]